MDEADPAATQSAVLVLHDARIQLRRRADKRIKDALRIGTLLLAGLNGRETQEQLDLSTAEYREALAWLRSAIKQAKPDD